MRTLDTRHLHRRPDAERLRFYGKQESSTKLQSPFGQVPFRAANQLSQQQIQPLLMGLGLGTGKKAQRLQQQIESGQAKGPLAAAIRSIQQFAPNVLPSAQALGEQLAGQGEQAVQGLQSAITTAQAAMPRYQAATDLGLDVARQGVQGAQTGFQQAQQMLPQLQALGQQGIGGAQQALNLAQQYTGGPAVTGAQDAVSRAQELLRGGPQGAAQSAVDLAQRYAQQAASPIGGEDLYQVAARRVLQQVRPGLAARGLEAGGAGQQAETDVLRDLTYNFAQQRGQERQQTLQGLGQATQTLGGLQQAALGGLGQATGQLGNIQQQGLQGLQNAAQGLTQTAGAAGQLPGQVLMPWLQALQQGGQGIQQAAGQGAQMLMQGPQLAGQQAQAVNQLGQALMQRYGIPMQQAGSLLNLLTAGVSPGLQLTQATAPVGVPSSKGTQIL